MEHVRQNPFLTHLLNVAEPEPFADWNSYWFKDIGIGYLPIRDPAPYDAAYFERYKQQADTSIGRALMDIRTDQVMRVMTGGELVDVGIGCGAFIEAMQAISHTIAVYGSDVNPAGCEWLRARGILWPEGFDSTGLSMWDVLEHIPDFGPVLRRARKYVFLSVPLFTDREHALRSKHFRPQEHCWYFTEDGIEYAMARHGFRMAEAHTFEVAAGREDVMSFSFIRR